MDAIHKHTPHRRSLPDILQVSFNHMVHSFAGEQVYYSICLKEVGFRFIKRGGDTHFWVEIFSK